MKINLFDFDKTIYDGDSTVDFYIYCLKKYPRLIILWPRQFVAATKYLLKKTTKGEMKAEFYLFLKYIKNIDLEIEMFWNIKNKKLKDFYLNRKDKSNDIIISASPEFLLQPICNQLGVKKLIASLVDKKTGKLLSRNCYGEEKVKRLNEIYKKFLVEESYSDSYSDKPILELAKRAYLVKGNKIIEYKKDK